MASAPWARLPSAPRRPPRRTAGQRKPGFLVIWDDDIGISIISFNNRGLMGYSTPIVDRIAKERVAFIHYCGRQSCTAGRIAFIVGNNPTRPGMTKVVRPGGIEGWQKADVSIAVLR